MRATLSFSLPDEEEEHRAALHGADYKSAIEAFARFLDFKISHEEMSQSNRTLLYEVREKLLNCVEDFGVEFFSLD